MQTNRDWLDIDHDERLVWSSHPSRWIVWGKVLLGLVVLIGAFRMIQLIPFTSAKIGPFRLDFLILLIAVVGGFAPALYAHIRRKTTMYVMTDRAVWYKAGIYKRESVDRIELHEITDRDYSQSGFDRLVSKGQFQIMTKGTGKVDMEFWDVPKPGAVKSLLRDTREEALSRRGMGRDQPSQSAQNRANQQRGAGAGSRERGPAGEHHTQQSQARQQQANQRGPAGGQGQQGHQQTTQANAQHQNSRGSAGQHQNPNQQARGQQNSPRNQHQQNQQSSRSQQRESQYTDKETRDTDSLHHPAYDDNGDDGPHYID